jgi:CBS domain containing-hemolysin-like protein
LEGKIPEKGEVIKYRNFKFTIMDATSRMIKEVKIMITKEDTANEE